MCVDVGGGIGALTAALLDRFPNLHGVVQDRPEVIVQAKVNFEKRMPEAIARAAFASSRATFSPRSKARGRRGCT